MLAVIMSHVFFVFGGQGTLKIMWHQKRILKAK